MNSADVGERPPLCFCCVIVFRASHVHGIGDVEPCSLEIAPAGLVVTEGDVGLMAASSLSDSP